MGSISVLECFSIGIGPSSSHTVGPMRATKKFLIGLKERELLEEISSVKIELFGSLAMTGKGHASDTAILLGLLGFSPEEVDPDQASFLIENIKKEGAISIFSRISIPFSIEEDIVFLKGKKLPFHSNAMRLKAWNSKKKLLDSKVFYSIGGGFILEHSEALSGREKAGEKRAVPYPYQSAQELLDYAEKAGKKIWEIVLENERALGCETRLWEGIDRIWQTMKLSVERGLKATGTLPGGLGVLRKAPMLYASLMEKNQSLEEDPAQVMDWVSLFAMAVNEENAAGNRVVTAPTNGSCGVIPGVLFYAQKFTPNFDRKSLHIFFLTATALLVLFKKNASISAAEMGCQGEIGVSSSMAAGGLAAIWGGTNQQIENAAEIAMEHHLGMTCDPIAGLVQIPCIERNAMGAIKAIQAARLALKGTGEHVVSLDAVIRAMNETGKNMQSKYKETSEGGLALQISLAMTAC